MCKSWVLSAVVLFGALAAVAAGQLYDDRPYGAPPRGALPPRWFPGEGMPVEVSDFRGEIVVVPHSGSDGQQVISGLLKPRVRHLGNRQYLVGQEIATQGAGRSTKANVTVWIPLEDTSELFEYRSVEEARKLWNLGGRAEEAADEAVEVIEDGADTIAPGMELDVVKRTLRRHGYEVGEEYVLAIEHSDKDAAFEFCRCDDEIVLTLLYDQRTKDVRSIGLRFIPDEATQKGQRVDREALEIRLGDGGVYTARMKRIVDPENTDN